ncbi:hypothetical protein [Pedobacter endophyticus]|uniref:PD-(D/E)XK nuclease superfamily protein n=1 Tax=Pedobacter endophyticus TaxID=2789740 RepID=A0A7U3SQR8_9SPHI|nr:hypothetical protein [Pedobacter endophyticus]QPH38636.1 hypothetical protein IZT61_16355 [Pedobacter endophyticus]
MQYIAVLGYKDVFNEDIPENPLAYIEAYPTEFLLLRLSKINAMLFQDPDSRNVDSEIIKHAIFADIQGFEIPAEFQNNFKSEKRWFSPAPIAMLITEILKDFKTVEKDRVINTLAFSRNLFKTILIYNQLYYSRYGDEDMMSLQGVFRLEIMQQNYLRNTGPMKMMTLMKFAFISKFLDVHLALKQDAIEFCKEMQLGNPWLYGKFFLEVLTLALTSVNKGKHVLNVKDMPERLMREYAIDISKLSGKDQLSLNMDIVPKPFYFIDDNQAIILDYSFFQYAVEQGFFYSFYQNSPLKNDKRFKDYNTFKSYIGLHFFEKFLVERYLKAIFHKQNQKIISTDKYQDYIVKASSTDVFIFEVKMTDVHAKTIEQMDYKKFKIFLDENFLSEKSNGKKDKGAAQIIRQIDNLTEPASELLKMVGIKSLKKINIYPVIICSDSNVDISGAQQYVNAIFNEKLQNRRESFQSIKPLMLLHVDFLIKYFGPLKNNSALLSELLNGYFKSQKTLNQNLKAHPGIHNYFVAKRPFHAYLSAKNLPDTLEETVKTMTESFDLQIIDFGITEYQNGKTNLTDPVSLNL